MAWTSVCSGACCGCSADAETRGKEARPIVSSDNGTVDSDELTSLSGEVEDDLAEAAVPAPAEAEEPAETPEDEPDPAAEMREALKKAPGEWYVVHSYAGYENKVKANLETRIHSL